MKKNKIIFGSIFLIVILGWGGLWYWNYWSKKNEQYNNEKEAILGKCDYNFEFANTEELRKKGLSERDNLCAGCGMLFLFGKEGNYYFWMKDMRFPIDIIWLKDNKVVDINQNVNHKSRSVYSTHETADKVLELNANDVDRCEIKIGDELKKKKNAD